MIIVHWTYHDYYLNLHSVIKQAFFSPVFSSKQLDTFLADSITFYCHRCQLTLFFALFPLLISCEYIYRRSATLHLLYSAGSQNFLRRRFETIIMIVLTCAGRIFLPIRLLVEQSLFYNKACSHC